MARLEVITGPMFSGKSEELIRRLRIAAFAEKNLLLVRPNKDDREERNIFNLVSADMKLNNYAKLEKRLIDFPNDLNEMVISVKPDVLGIDEAQFLFDSGYLDLVTDLLNKRKMEDFTIIVSGLNLDAEGRSFGLMSEYMARADDLKLQTAICTKCKRGGAIFTQKIAGSRKQIEIGGANIYTVHCRECFIKQSEMPLI